MPTLPWTPAAANPDATATPPPDVVVLGSRLGLRRYRDVPGFLIAAMRIRRQVRRSPGVLGVSLIAQPTRKTFWTLSAWSEQDAIDRFVPAPPHVDVMHRFHDRLDGASFTTWSRRADGLPKRGSNAAELWAEARERLAGVATA